MLLDELEQRQLAAIYRQQISNTYQDVPCFELIGMSRWIVVPPFVREP